MKDGSEGLMLQLCFSSSVNLASTTVSLSYWRTQEKQFVSKCKHFLTILINVVDTKIDKCISQIQQHVLYSNY